MKKNLSIAFCGVVLALGAVACSGKGNEEKAKEFAADFARKAAANQIDSLKDVYPGIENADSVALKYVEEGIVVKPSGDNGNYEVILSPDVTIIISPYGDGSFSVMESRGLFAYPQEMINIARESEAWNDTANDVELSIIVNKSFQNYLEQERKKETEANIAVNDFFTFSGSKIRFYKSPSEINSYLTSLGYTLVSSQTIKGDPDADIVPDTEDWTTKTYDCDGVKVETIARGDVNNSVINSVSIRFKNKEQTQFFVDNMKSSGWKLNNDFIPGYSYISGYKGSIIYIEVKGNTVELLGLWE